MLNIQSEKSDKTVTGSGESSLFIVTQRKPFKVFKVVSTQEPNLPSFFSLTRIIVDAQEQLKTYLCSSVFRCPLWLLLSLLDVINI